MTTASTNRAAKLPTYPSMSACAGATGIPAEVLRKAKNAGCPAFHSNGRVNLSALLPWLFTPVAGEAAAKESFREAELREKIAKADLLELKRKEREKDLVNMGEAKEACVELVQPVARMVKEMPARLCQRCNPSDPALAKQVLTDYARELCEKVQEVGK